jgi:hypothetical protein
MLSEILEKEDEIKNGEGTAESPETPMNFGTTLGTDGT